MISTLTNMPQSCPFFFRCLIGRAGSLLVLPGISNHSPRPPVPARAPDILASFYGHTWTTSAWQWGDESIAYIGTSLWRDTHAQTITVVRALRKELFTHVTHAPFMHPSVGSPSVFVSIAHDAVPSSILCSHANAPLECPPGVQGVIQGAEEGCRGRPGKAAHKQASREHKAHKACPSPQRKEWQI